MASLTQVSPQVAEEIDREVQRIIEATYQAALDILRENRQLLLSLAQTLLDKEVQEGEALRLQLSSAHRNSTIDRWLQSGQNGITDRDSSSNGKFSLSC